MNRGRVLENLVLVGGLATVLGSAAFLGSNYADVHGNPQDQRRAELQSRMQDLERSLNERFTVDKFLEMDPGVRVAYIRKKEEYGQLSKELEKIPESGTFRSVYASIAACALGAVVSLFVGYLKLTRHHEPQGTFRDWGS